MRIEKHFKITYKDLLYCIIGFFFDLGFLLGIIVLILSHFDFFTNNKSLLKFSHVIVYSHILRNFFDSKTKS